MNAITNHSNKKKISIQGHWNNLYKNSDPDKLGWYEERARPSLDLINECVLSKDARILNVGAGATTLIDDLLNEGYENIIATDISEMGLHILKDRLGDRKNEVQWIVDDLTNPQHLQYISPVDLWHDRAVLHFFLEKQEQKSYFDLIRTLVKEGGYVIIAAFNLQSAEKCSGLKAHRYNAKMIAEQLGPDFKLMQSFDYTYKMPSEDTRKYVYTLFQKPNDIIYPMWL